MNYLPKPLNIITILLLLLISNIALAEDERLAEADLELRAQNLFKIVKCPVCNGQVIAESDTEVSKLLRSSIRSKLSAGKSDEQILAEISKSYGAMNVLNKSQIFVNSGLLFLFSMLVIACVTYIYYRKNKR